MKPRLRESSPMLLREIDGKSHPDHGHERDTPGTQESLRVNSPKQQTCALSSVPAAWPACPTAATASGIEKAEAAVVQVGARQTCRRSLPRGSTECGKRDSSMMMGAGIGRQSACSRSIVAREGV